MSTTVLRVHQVCRERVSTELFLGQQQHFSSDIRQGETRELGRQFEMRLWRYC